MAKLNWNRANEASRAAFSRMMEREAEQRLAAISEARTRRPPAKRFRLRVKCVCGHTGTAWVTHAQAARALFRCSKCRRPIKVASPPVR